MKVYVDVVLLLNFLFDLILLISVNYILRRNTCMYRIILGSIIGELSFLILFIEVNNITFLLIKILISLLMIYVTFGYKDSKCYFKNVLYFYLVSMLLGGAMQFLDNQFSYSNNGLIFSNNGLGVSYVIVLIIGLFIYMKYIKSFKSFSNNYGYYYRCRIFIDDDNSIDVTAFLDTGNKLYIPYLGKVIILVDKEKMKNIELNRPIYVPFNSLNNSGLLECYKCKCLEIDGKVYDKFLLGISNEKFYMDGIDCIINNTVMEGLR